MRLHHFGLTSTRFRITKCGRTTHIGSHWSLSTSDFAASSFSMKIASSTNGSSEFRASHLRAVRKILSYCTRGYCAYIYHRDRAKLLEFLRTNVTKDCLSLG